jgi:hypothetical protein
MTKILSQIVIKKQDQIFYELESEFFANILQNQAWSTRFNPIWKYERTDTNIFVLASAVFILNELKPYLSEKQLIVFNTFKDTIVGLFPKYQNLKGLPTYNFYSNFPISFFPNGLLMKHFNHFKLPDDIDDTSLIWSLSEKYPSKISDLKNLLAENATNTPYGRVYNTWFSQNMPPDVDVCALCNLLNLLLNSKENLSNLDNNSITFLSETIKDLPQKTFWLSRHYGNLALILYHYARLMSNHNIESLEQHKQNLIELAYQKRATESNPLFKILIETALLKWGEKLSDVSIVDLTKINPSFYSFIGAPLAPYPFLKTLASKKPFILYYKSRFHELTLILEHFILSNKIKQI